MGSFKNFIAIGKNFAAAVRDVFAKKIPPAPAPVPAVVDADASIMKAAVQTGMDLLARHVSRTAIVNFNNDNSVGRHEDFFQRLGVRAVVDVILDINPNSRIAFVNRETENGPRTIIKASTGERNIEIQVRPFGMQPGFAVGDLLTRYELADHPACHFTVTNGKVFGGYGALDDFSEVLKTVARLGRPEGLYARPSSLSELQQ